MGGSTSASSGSAAPKPPAVSVTSPTNNRRPAWNWNSGGDGNGTYRYKLDDPDLENGATQTVEVQFTPAVDLAEGVHTLYVQERNDAGTWSSSGSATVHIDLTPPEPPVVQAVSPPSSANENHPLIIGTAAVGSVVTLYTDSTCSSPVAATGSSSDFAASGIAVPVPDDSTTVFHATAMDEAGNVSSCSMSSVTYVEDSTAPGQVTFTASSPASPVAHNHPAIMGTAEPGSTVRLYIDNTCTSAVAARGTAEVFASPGLTVHVGNSTTTVFHATATDGAGNVSPCSTANLEYVDLSPTTGPALGHPAQRKTFHDPTTNKHWGFHHESGLIHYASSADGTAWVNAGTMGYDTPDFSVTAHAGQVYLVVSTPGANGNDVVVRRGVLGDSAIAFDEEESILAAPAGGTFTRPSAAMDGNGRLWVGAVRTLGSEAKIMARRTTNAADEDVVSWNKAVTLGGVQSFVESVVMVPRTGEEMFLVANGEAVVSYVYNGAAWSEATDTSNGAWMALGGNTLLVGTVNAALVWRGELYVGGSFAAAGGNPYARNIAKWNGNRWVPVGAGVDGVVNALVRDASGNIYAAGGFFAAGDVAVNRIAVWNGVAWSALGSGMDGDVLALAVEPAGNLYAGGSFFNAGGVGVHNIARWDGLNWSALGDGMDNNVTALTLDGSGSLYAGGSFTRAGVVSASRVARWDGTEWSALGSGMNDVVTALEHDGSGNLYAGGSFTQAGGMSANYVARWDGTTWSALGPGMDNAVSAFSYHGGLLYAGGRFTKAGSQDATRLAVWNGTDWEPVGRGLDGWVKALAPDGFGNIHVGGTLLLEGNARSALTWNGSQWSVLGTGMDCGVTALASGTNAVTAGGCFSTVGGTAAKSIARWNDTSWTPLGSGTGGTVSALVHDAAGNLFVGGQFLTAGGRAANRIARWDGTAWSALGTGMNGAVASLAVDDGGNLYASGVFTTAGGVSANRIATWDGAGWSALGTGMNGEVASLAVDGAGHVYAGGAFTTAGGVMVNRIAMWDGTQWSALAGGMDGPVSALAVDSAGNLYAGGVFSMAGGVAASNIARWNGISWSAVGTGTDGMVSALAEDGSGGVYAGGAFTTAGGVEARFIARWNGTTWSALGRAASSPLAPVQAIVLHRNVVIVGHEGGVHEWRTGVFAEPVQQMAATRDVVSNAVWMVSRNGANVIQARRYNPAGTWSAPTDVITARTVGDMGVGFDAARGLGVVLASDGAQLHKIDFTATGTFASTADVVASGSSGLFTVGASPSQDGNFSVMHLGLDGVLRRTVVQAEAP